MVKVTEMDYTFDRQIMFEREDARAEGRVEGMDTLASVISRLKSGETEQQLLDDGIEEYVLNIAKTLT